MAKLLKFLQGKKGAIASVIWATVAYLAVKGLLGEAEVILIGSLSTILFGAASYETKKMYKK